MPQALLPIFAKESTQINSLLSFENRSGTIYYFHACLPVFSHDEKDNRSFKMFTSQLVDMGQCTQMEIVRAFGVSAISVKRQVKKFRAEGPGAFFVRRRSKRSTVWTADALNRAQELLNQGQARDAVADLMEIKRDTFYRAVHQGRLTEPKKKVAVTKATEA